MEPSPNDDASNELTESIKKQLLEIYLAQESRWKDIEKEMKEMNAEITELSSLFLEGIEKSKEIENVKWEHHDIFSDRVMECAKETDDMVADVVSNYFELFNEGKQILTDFSESIEDAIIGKSSDDVIKDFDDLLDVKVTTPLRDLLADLESDSESVQAYIRKCIDSALYVLRTSYSRFEL